MRLCTNYMGCSFRTTEQIGYGSPLNLRTDKQCLTIIVVDLWLAGAWWPYNILAGSACQRGMLEP